MWKYFDDHHIKSITSWSNHCVVNVRRGCIEDVIERNHDDFAGVDWVRSIINQEWAFIQ